MRNLPDLPVPDEVPAPLGVEDLPHDLLYIPFAVPLTTPGHRHAATVEARARGFGLQPVLVDPTAVVASSARLGEGSYVNAGAIVAAGVRAGESFSLNRGASVGHSDVGVP